jgi:gluconokinase
VHDQRVAGEPPVLVLMGVSGCGKSTVGALLAGRLEWDFEEGDDLHPAANVDKMASGEPLDDEDRWPWLAKVAEWIGEHTDAGRPGIITCSALKKGYRDVLRGEQVVFVYLAGTREQIARRLAARTATICPRRCSTRSSTRSNRRQPRRTPSPSTLRAVRRSRRMRSSSASV